MRFFAAFILIVFASINSRASSVDTTTLNYPIGVYKLSAKNKQVLSAISNRLKIGDSVHIAGFTDYLGNTESNMKLSVKRATAVKSHLISLNKTLAITMEGKGEIPAGQTVKNSLGNYKDRRVDILIFKKIKDSVSVTKPKDAVVSKSPLEKIKTLARLAPGESFVLDDLNFQPGRHFPTQLSMYYLENLLYYLLAHPGIEFEIQGHICCTTGGGDGIDADTGEPELSVTRAKFVYEYFSKRGIATNRMSFKGFGSSKKKITPEITEEDRQANRRVELLILKQ